MGYWGGNQIYLYHQTYPYTYNPDAPVWNKPEQTEFLLYDFNYKVGDSYKWPWSGIEFYIQSPDGNSESTKTERGFLITSIENLEPSSDSEKESDRKVFTIEQTEEKGITYDEPVSIIVEGIGITNGHICSYYIDTTAWFGFFVAPSSVSLFALASWYTLPKIPELKAVITQDGNHIYGDPDYTPSAGVNGIEIEKAKYQRTFDLHGREVSNPIPGSIYIRNGKKFVAK